MSIIDVVRKAFQADLSRTVLHQTMATEVTRELLGHQFQALDALLHRLGQSICERSSSANRDEGEEQLTDARGVHLHRTLVEALAVFLGNLLQSSDSRVTDLHGFLRMRKVPQTLGEPLERDERQKDLRGRIRCKWQCGSGTSRAESQPSASKARETSPASP